MEANNREKATELFAIQQKKKILRTEILKRRDAMTAEQRNRAAILLTERILGHQWYYGSTILLVFVSYGSEIDTKDIIRTALQHGKKVFVPKVVAKEMEFYQIEDLSQLQEGFHGILEPVGNSRRFDDSLLEEERILMIMPGVAFDPANHRMGYGGGYYDRFLERYETLRLRTIAVGYTCQLVEQIPVGEHDIQPYQVICL